MNIMDELRLTDELRRFANEWDWLDYKADDSARKLRAIADRIDAEHERVTMNAINDALHQANEDDMVELGWIRIPKDVDGEYIHIGDMVTEHEDGHTFTVDGFMTWDDEWWVFQRDAIQAPARRCTHHKPPTVEDVLVAMLEQAVGYSDAHTSVALNTIAEYAAKLQLRGEDE